ncbi:IS66 family transposase [Pseudovibrio sp. WM33]|uniref:IS66 family transposase n=1 Tax=Pseudovibrio sp. WM33 TaxID=1735585 RepID=UPI0007AEAE69|nr:transposase [Pseudovibrio sp. WM33]KZL27768.1 Transposase IS66 family protein [Pseudovibrio sp. WM33]
MSAAETTKEPGDARVLLWSHARRKLYEVARNKTTPVAQKDLRQIGDLHQIEKDDPGQNPKERLLERQERSREREQPHLSGPD